MNEITVEQLKQKVDSGHDINVIDVREPDEYQESNMGAKLIPLSQLSAMQFDEIENLKNEEVIVHCRSGKRSMQACMILEQAGFTNCVNVQGGIMAWQDKYGDAKIK